MYPDIRPYKKEKRDTKGASLLSYFKGKLKNYV
jgi:hypothetical protein